jgi:hypothetical protein
MLRMAGYSPMRERPAFRISFGLRISGFGLLPVSLSPPAVSRFWKDMRLPGISPVLYWLQPCVIGRAPVGCALFAAAGPALHPSAGKSHGPIVLV